MMFEKFSKTRPGSNDGREGRRPRGLRRGRRQDAALHLLDLLALVPGDAPVREGMYEDPEQDLNKLWWDLVEKYQVL